MSPSKKNKISSSTFRDSLSANLAHKDVNTCKTTASASSNKALPGFISQQVSQSKYFFLRLKPNIKSDLAVVCGGKETCEPGYSIDRSSFAYFALEYVAQGQGTFQSSSGSYPLQSGSVFAYKPDTPHKIYSSPDNPMVKYFVDFTGKQALELIDQNKSAQLHPIKLGQMRWFQDIFDQLIETGSHPSLAIEAHCLLLLKTLMSLLTLDGQTVEQADSISFETFTRCRKYAEQNFITLSTTEKWANMCHVDQAYLSRLFKRFSQKRPYQFLVSLKMDYAAYLLTHRKISSKQVAIEVGIPDPQHFSRVFKQVHGISPRNFLALREAR